MGTNHESAAKRSAKREERIGAMHAKALAEAKEAARGEHHGPAFFGVLPLARELLREGDPEAVAWATELIQNVLDSQMTAPRNPHRGNFVWLAGDEEIIDFNAVLVVLRDFTPLLLEYESKLAPEFLELCRERLILALAEVERMDVSPIYSGVHQVMLFGLLLGAQWLGDTHFIDLARQRWQRWYDFTVDSGTTHEFISPVYAGWALTGQAMIQRFVSDPEIVLQSRMIYERLWLSLGTRVHRPTKQVAAPHSRIYWGPMLSGMVPLKEILWRETGWDWLLKPGPYVENPAISEPCKLDLAQAPHWLPPVVEAWIKHQDKALPYQVDEISDILEGSDITTYLTPSYALGSTNQTYSIGTECFYIDHEANHLMLQYVRPEDKGGWGMAYTRYVVNDRHMGKLTPAPDRGPGSFYDQGNFAGVQSGNKAIGLYALKRQDQLVDSLKTVVAFQSGEALEEVWVNGKQVAWQDLPCDVQIGDWIVVGDGSVYVGVHVLEPSCLGSDIPILLEQGPMGELWLTVYNYKGVGKRFWDYASLGGAWWRGNIRAGVIFEVGERQEYASAQEFLQHLQASTISDYLDDEFVRTVTYRSGDDVISIDYDLWNTEPVGRRINGKDYQAPNLCSPLAVQGDGGKLTVGSATLYTNPQQVWLVAQEVDPTETCWVAVNPLDAPTPLRLETPEGIVTAEAWGLGRLEWRVPANGPQSIVIEALEEPTGLTVPEGVDVQVKLTE